MADTSKATPRPWRRKSLTLVAERGIIMRFPVPQDGGVFDVQDNIEFTHRAVNNYDRLRRVEKLASDLAYVIGFVRKSGCYWESEAGDVQLSQERWAFMECKARELQKELGGH